MNTHDLEERSARLLALLRTRGLKVVTAESCTGGLVAGALTAIAGSSDVVDRGFVTYSNAAKTDMLGVPRRADHKAWRGERTRRARHGRGRSVAVRAEISVAITGIAGPGGADGYQACRAGASGSERDAAGRHCISSGDTAISAARRCGMQPCSTRSN